VIIHPSQTIIRDTARSFEIDDNDPDFIRDPTGLFALYLGHEPPLLLIGTETENEWDIVSKIWAVHFDKLERLFSEARQAYISPVSTGITGDS